MVREDYTRRKALAGGLAVVTGATINVSGRVESKKRVVTARGGRNDEPRETQKVPIRWRRNEIAIEEAVDGLADKVLHHDFVQSVGSHISPRRVGSEVVSRASITVNENASSSALDELPETLGQAGIAAKDAIISDIHVQREPADSQPLVCEGFKTDTSFHGGWRVIGPNGSKGTAGFPLYDGNKEYILTANHVTKSGGTCNVGVEANDTNKDYIGDVAIAEQDHDWAAVLIASSSHVDSINNSIWYDEGLYAPVGGYKTDDGVRAMKGDSGAAKAQGVSSGYTEGTVVENNTFYIGGPNGCYAGDGNDIKIENSGSKFVAQGDSGGPIFDYNASTGEAFAIITTSYGNNKQGTVNCGEAQAYSVVHGYSVEALVKNNSFYLG